MFENEDRRDHSQDTLTVVKGLTGSYPNFFFVIDNKDVDTFVKRVEAVRDRDDYERLVGLYGMVHYLPARHETSHKYCILGDF